MYSRPSLPSKCRLNYLDYFERILPLPFDIIFMGACSAGRPPCPSPPLYLGRAASVEPGWARPRQQWNNTTAAELRRLMRAWTAGWPRGCSGVISNSWETMFLTATSWGQLSIPLESKVESSDLDDCPVKKKAGLRHPNR